MSTPSSCDRNANVVPTRCVAQVVSFVHVADGCFHRAGKYKGANPNEAKSVADTVRRLVAGGVRSIGVVTFSVAHKAAIDDALAAARIADVFTPDEPLMVKSIEQVGLISAFSSWWPSVGQPMGAAP